MKPWMLVAAGVAIVALALFAVLRQPNSDSGKGRERAAQAAQDSTKELRALRQEVEVLKRNSEMSQVEHVTSETGSGIASASTTPEQETPRDPEQSARDRHRETIRSLDARFVGEPVDGEWSLKTVREIRDVVGSSAPGTQLLKAECASSLCRVTVSHETEEAQKTLGRALAAEEPFRAGVVYDYDFDSNPRKTMFFVMRAGPSFRGDPKPL
jgi:hypothetical protein